MSWRAVLRNDLRESTKSRGVWVLTAALFAGFTGISLLVARVAEPDVGAFFDVAATIAALLLPLVGVVLGYKTVVDERESGSLVLLMSLPHSRGELVVGKLLGRFVVLTLAFSAGAVGALLVLVVEYGSFSIGRYLLFTLAALAYCGVFVAIATALSLAFTTSRRVVAAAFGAYLLLVMLWNQLLAVVVVVLFRFEAGALAQLPDWATFLTFCNPRTALVYLLAEGLEVGSGVNGVAFGSQWYASLTGAVVVFVVWAVVPLVLGYVRFTQSEL